MDRSIMEGDPHGILEGLILLMERRPAMYIQDRLNSFLDRDSQYSMKAGA